MQQLPEKSEPSALLHGNRELAVLYVIAGYLNRQVDVHDALQEVLTHVTDLLGMRTGCSSRFTSSAALSGRPS
jgi:two-component system NarL family sensor kinase